MILESPCGKFRIVSRRTFSDSTCFLPKGCLGFPRLLVPSFAVGGSDLRVRSNVLPGWRCPYALSSCARANPEGKRLSAGRWCGGSKSYCAPRCLGACLVSPLSCRRCSRVVAGHLPCRSFAVFLSVCLSAVSCATCWWVLSHRRFGFFPIWLSCPNPCRSFRSNVLGLSRPPCCLWWWWKDPRSCRSSASCRRGALSRVRVASKRLS